MSGLLSNITPRTSDATSKTTVPASSSTMCNATAGDSTSVATAQSSLVPQQPTTTVSMHAPTTSAVPITSPCVATALQSVLSLLTQCNDIVTPLTMTNGDDDQYRPLTPPLEDATRSMRQRNPPRRKQQQQPSNSLPSATAPPQQKLSSFHLRYVAGNGPQQRSSTDSITLDPKDIDGEPQSPNNVMTTTNRSRDGGGSDANGNINPQSEQLKKVDPSERQPGGGALDVVERSPSMFDAVSSGRNSVAFMRSVTTLSSAPSPITMSPTRESFLHQQQQSQGLATEQQQFGIMTLLQKDLSSSDDDGASKSHQQQQCHQPSLPIHSTTNSVGTTALPSFLAELYRHINNAQHLIRLELNRLQLPHFNCDLDHHEASGGQHSENCQSLPNLQCVDDVVAQQPDEDVSTPQAPLPPDTGSGTSSFPRAGLFYPQQSSASFSVFVFPPPQPQPSSPSPTAPTLSTQLHIPTNDDAKRNHHSHQGMLKPHSPPKGASSRTTGTLGISPNYNRDHQPPLTHTLSSSHIVAALPMWPQSPSFDPSGASSSRTDFARMDFIAASDRSSTTASSSPRSSLLPPSMAKLHQNHGNPIQSYPTSLSSQHARASSLATTATTMTHEDSQSTSTDVQSVLQHALQLTTTLQKEKDEATGEKMINQYVILDDIGEGACGKVKLAYSLERNITVAIKIVRRATGTVEGRALGRRGTIKEDTVRHEIQLMTRLRHPNLVSLFEVIDDPNAKKLYLVMRFADKGSVGAMREDLTCDAMPLRALVDMAFQVCCGLQYLHERGIYHRDIKPENILQTSDGQYMIGDFGISVIRRRRSTSSTSTALSSSTGILLDDRPLGIGTPLFMAPELLRSVNTSDEGDSNDVSDCLSADDRVAMPAADMWALGVTLLTLAFGTWPFENAHELRVDPRSATIAASQEFLRLVEEKIDCMGVCGSRGCKTARSEWAFLVSQLLVVDVLYRPSASVLRKQSKALLRSLCDSCSQRFLSDVSADVGAVSRKESHVEQIGANQAKRNDDASFLPVTVAPPVGAIMNNNASLAPSSSSSPPRSSSTNIATNSNTMTPVASTLRSTLVSPLRRRASSLIDELVDSRDPSVVTMMMASDDPPMMIHSATIPEGLTARFITVVPPEDGNAPRRTSTQQHQQHQHSLYHNDDIWSAEEDPLSLLERQNRLRRHLTMYESWNSGHPHSARSSVVTLLTNGEDDDVSGGGHVQSTSHRVSIPHPPPLAHRRSETSL